MKYGKGNIYCRKYKRLNSLSSKAEYHCFPGLCDATITRIKQTCVKRATNIEINKTCRVEYLLIGAVATVKVTNIFVFSDTT